ncbi:hypothetical protein FQN49_000259 [Arthroderma sp. PD_2]|nr:hypothetical protein FQN49_000259 [Arthroderma sp. PD_2]
MKSETVDSALKNNLLTSRAASREDLLFTWARRRQPRLVEHPIHRVNIIKARALILEPSTMGSTTRINTAILDTLMDQKKQVVRKLEPLLKRFKAALDKDSIYFSDEQLPKYGIHKSRMDLEQGGRFFKPIPPEDFETWVLHEDFYSIEEWDPEAKEIGDAKQVFWKFWRLLWSELPGKPRDEYGSLPGFNDYTPWDEVLLVLMVSCFNRQVRMNEVYFEDGILYFNCTPFIDLSKFEKPNLDLYARWALSNPVGETTEYPGMKPLKKVVDTYLSERRFNRKQKSKSRSKIPEKPELKRVMELRGR